ncbi:MAG TPA: hypothetical protein VJV23_01545 [Candidatus Polarisedimenticolia bacterium]|nr:hypothetical protein [Candidatus Polarisedimenticolia bacterium]
MKRIPTLAMTLLAALAAASTACSSRRPGPAYENVRVPPAIDLRQHEMIGVVEFESSSRGKLGPLATRRFTEEARREQGMIRMVDLGPQDQALRSVSRDRWDPAAFQAVGRDRGVRTLVAGRLTVSEVKPDIRVAATLRSGQITARVDATLEVQLIETATGASLWSGSARATREVGHISVLRGRAFSFDADDPEAAYGDLVDALVGQVTRDFKATWERRPAAY